MSNPKEIIELVKNSRKAAKYGKKFWNTLPDDVKKKILKMLPDILEGGVTIYDEMPDEMLKIYIPDVYQHDIYAIDYDRLKEKGIKLISFDIDDTLIAFEDRNPSTNTLMNIVILFARLKKMGFTIIVISNANDERTKMICEKLEADGYVARAEKPSSNGFVKARELYNEKNNVSITPKEMAHVGNSMHKDIAGGNSYGVTTCLVRRVGKLKPPKGMKLTAGQKMRSVLKKRGMWYKHHRKVKGDQYYQLGETQKQ